MGKWEVFRGEDRELVRYVLREDSDVHIEKLGDEYWLLEKGSVIKVGGKLEQLKELGGNIKWMEGKWNEIKRKRS